MKKATYTPLLSLTAEVSRESDKFMLRLPEGMREAIAEAAKANGRSMNAEIVKRLGDTFIATEISALNEKYSPSPPSVHVILDTNGRVISWDEIGEYLRALRISMGVDVISMHTTVLTPDLASSSERQEEARAIRRLYDANNSDDSKIASSHETIERAPAGKPKPRRNLKID